MCSGFESGTHKDFEWLFFEESAGMAQNSQKQLNAAVVGFQIDRTQKVSIAL